MAQLSALLQPNVQVFDEFIRHLMSADNVQRGEAEKLFQSLRSSQPVVCVQQLTGTMLGSPTVENRSFSAIMLRRVLTKGETPVWMQLDQNQKDQLKGQFLQAIQNEPEREVTRKICDAASDIANNAVTEGQWPELVPFIFQCLETKDPKHMESALNIFAETAAVTLDQLDNHLPNLQKVFQTCLQSGDSVIRLAALRAVAATILYTEKKEVVALFKPLVPSILEVLGKFLHEADEVSAQEAITLLVEVADSQPRFLKNDIEAVLNAMLSIANHGTLEDSTRQLAVEFFVTLCEVKDRAPGLLRKVPHIIEGFFKCLMMFLLDLEDSPEWHASQDESSEDAGHWDKFEFSQEALDRIALCLGGRQLVPLAGQMLPQWLQDSDWKKRHAVLISLAQIAEGCEKQLQSQKEVLTAMCLKGLQDSHAKVKWAACQAIGQLCTDLGPQLQYQEHTKIIPALWAAMEDFANPRVQAHATAALVNFCEGIVADSLQSYLDELITRLIQILQNGSHLAKIGALTAIASVADCVEGAFNRYYETVMPLLMHMLTQLDASQMMIRAKALEAISLVCMAVDVYLFRPHVGKVMDVLQQLHASNFQPDDPIVGYMYQAGARLCKTLGKEFIPYLGIVLPPLLKAAAQKPDIQVKDYDSDEDEEEDEDVQSIPLAGKRLQVKTSSLDDKATACSMLCCYASELQEGFFPYVQQVLEMMVPCLRFFFHEEVRKAAVQNLPELLKCSLRAVEMGQAPTEYVKEMINFMWEPLLDALNKELEVDVEDLILEALDEIVVAAGKQYLALEQLQKLFETLKQAMESSQTRRQDRIERTQEAGDELDEEDLDALNEEEKVEQELMESITNVIGSTLKKFGDEVIPPIETYIMPYLAQLVNSKQSPDFRRVGICVMDDILDYTHNGGLKYVQQFMPVLMETCVHPDNADLRQCAFYGLGLVAERHPTFYRNFHGEVVERVVAILKHPEAKSQDNELSTDNAISALGKIIKVHSDLLNGQQDYVGIWLAKLPIKGDTSEANVMHGQLVDMVEMNDSRVLGNLPQVAKIFIEVLAQGTKLVGAEYANKMVSMLKQMESQLQPGFVQKVAGELAPKEQERFKRVLMGQA